MKRQKKERYEGTRYPDLDQPLDRRTVLRGLGGLVGAVTASTAVGGCFTMSTGGVVDDNVDIYEIYLPDPSRTLFFFNDAYIDYQVYIRLDSETLRDLIITDTEALLEDIEELLKGHAIYDFAPGSDLQPIDNELRTLLDDWYNDLDLGGMRDVSLSVLDYDEGQEIDGDIDDSG